MTIVIPEAPSPIFRPVSATELAPILTRLGINFPYILYVGSTDARKNLPRLFEAFAMLHTDSPGRKLVIVGARDWRSDRITRTIEHLQLREAVHFIGLVQEEDLPALYCGADLFVFPSLLEGFGLPVIEAMACGTPVVTSTSSSLPEVAGEAAILVDPYDPAAIAAAMRRVLDNRALADDLRARGLARARQFSWEQTAHAMTVVYGKILSSESVR